MKKYFKRKFLIPLSLIITLAIILGYWLLGGGGAIAANGDLAQNNGEIPLIWYLAPFASVLALFFAFWFYRNMKRESEGTDKMKEIAESVREGANAYLKRQYSVVAIFLVILAGILAYLAFGMAVPVMNPWVPFAFLTGGLFSGLCGWLGMKTATYANARTAHAARSSLPAALKVSLRSGAVMGLIVVGFGLLDICIWFFVLNNLTGYSLSQRLSLSSQICPADHLADQPYLQRFFGAYRFPGED